MRPTLVSARAKYDRGVEHLDALYDKLGETDANSFDFAFKIEEEFEGYTHGGQLARIRRLYRIGAVSGAPGEAEGVILGDTLHNFRSCLDHIAWELVRRRGTGRHLTPRAAKGVYFPMPRKAAGLGDGWNSYLPGVPRADPYLALISRYQPHRRTTIGRDLRTLRDLSDSDKHRTVVPMLMAPLDLQCNLDVKGGRVVGPPTWHIRGKRLRPGVKVVELVIQARPGSQGYVEMQLNGRFYPELPNRESVEVRMNSIKTTCESALADFSKVI